MTETTATPNEAPKQTLLEHLAEKVTADGYDGTDEKMLIEWFMEDYPTVWEGDQDERRWYLTFDAVKEVEIQGETRFFKYTDYTITGDMGMSDMGLSYDLDDVREVWPRQVMTTIYE